MQDFHPLGPPFTCGILPGRYPDVLSRTEALGIAFVTLARRHTFTENDLGMSHFNTT
jgi:hypothetical protein